MKRLVFGLGVGPSAISPARAERLVGLTSDNRTVSFDSTAGFAPELGREKRALWRHLVTDVSSLAVPEPASWALRIGGFGMMGAALLRRARPGATIPQTA